MTRKPNIARLALAFTATLVAASPVASSFALPVDPGLSAPLAVIPIGSYEKYSNLPNGGYHVNRYGYGQYTRGTDGGFGGYPAGSAGAQILREQQRRKCDAVPEEC